MMSPIDHWPDRDEELCTDPRCDGRCSKRRKRPAPRPPRDNRHGVGRWGVRKRKPLPTMTDEERAFYAGFKSTMSDDDHRRNVRGSIRMAKDAITGVLGALSQSRSIKDPTEDDRDTRADLARIAALLNELKDSP